MLAKYTPTGLGKGTDFRQNRAMPETFTIRIQWGYWWWYAQHAFHHSHTCWDGYLQVRDGCIQDCSLLEFEGVFGPQRERLVPLSTPNWRWQPTRNFQRAAGVVFHVEGDGDTRVEFRSRAMDFDFRLGDLIEQKVIRHHAGLRYRANFATVHLEGRDPCLDDDDSLASLTAEDGRRRALLTARQISEAVEPWCRTDWIRLDPGQSVDIPFNLKPSASSHMGEVRTIRATLRCVGKPGRTGTSPAGRIVENVTIPCRVLANGIELLRENKFFGALRGSMQLMEEMDVRIPPDLFNGEPVHLTLHNDSARDHLLLARVYFEEISERPLQITTCPKWVLKGKDFSVAVTCRTPQQDVEALVPEGVVALDHIPAKLEEGEHRFRFRPDQALASFRIKFRSSTAGNTGTIDQVISVDQEPFPMKLGTEDVVFPPEDPGLREHIMHELADTQLGNYMIFRKAKNREQLIGWAAKCRELGLYCQMAHSIPADWIREARKVAGPYFVSWQWTEHDGPLWGYLVNPDKMPAPKPEEQRTMRTAHDAYVSYMRNLTETVCATDDEMESWVMISAIGHDAAYRGGMDVCISQMNKTHNALLFADARGAARAHRKPQWGAYMAEGAHLNPEGEHHLRMWWLSLHLAYICGASTANDEEAMFRTWHERLYGEGDRFPRTRRQMLRGFFQYVTSHPRRAATQVRQAMLIGRFACDSVDGIANSHTETTPVMVWRNFGGKTPAWRPGTPEYGLRYLDVFLPGVWLQSLEQDPERVRWLYSGTPYGELDLVPADADVDILQSYRLLFLLGWNTMDAPTYENLKSYVQTGGTLFMSVPQLTTNEGRGFLGNGMEPLNLLHGGDVEDLFGVRIRGRGEQMASVCSTDAAAGSPLDGINLPRRLGNILPAAGPIHDPVDTAHVEIAGAEVLVEAPESGQPLLVRHRVGDGEAYLLLTCDYPGNSWLVPFVTEVMHRLAAAIPSPIALHDPSGDVYYTVRFEDDTGVHRVHLLNTDWTLAGNQRHCTLRFGESTIPVTVQEGVLTEILCVGDVAVRVDDANVFVEDLAVTNDGLVATLHGYGDVRLSVSPTSLSLEKIQWSGKEVRIETAGHWTVLALSFGRNSVGELRIGIQ